MSNSFTDIKDNNNSSTWTKLNTSILVKAKFSYSNKGNSNCLSLICGDILLVTQECEDWYYGHSFLNEDREESGIFPKSYVYAVHDDALRASPSDAIKRRMQFDIISSLHEWLPTWRELVLSQTINMDKMLDIMHYLVRAYHDISTISYTIKRLESLEKNVISKIDYGNEMLKHDLVPRKDCIRVNESNLTFVELHVIHEETEKRIFNASPRGSVRDISKFQVNRAPLQMQVTATIVDFSYPGDLQFVWHLRDKTTKQCFFVPYQHSCRIPPNSINKQEVTFAFDELYVEEDEGDLFLEVCIYRFVSMIQPMESGKKMEIVNPGYRRPLGSAIQPISKENLLRGKEFALKIQSQIESDFLKLSKKPFGGRIFIKVNATNLKESKNVNLKDRRHRMFLKGGHKTVVDRDNLFLELISAECERGQKANARNVEVRIKIRHKNGQFLEIIENCDDHLSYLSAIYYHSNNPEWREIIQFNVCGYNIMDLHIVFQFFHCSVTKEKRSDERILFGFSVLPLYDIKSRVIRSGRMRLNISKDEWNITKMEEYLTRDYLCKDLVNGDKKDTVLINLNLCSTFRTQKDQMTYELVDKEMKSETAYLLRNTISLLKPEDYGKPELMRRIFINIVGQLTLQCNSELKQEIFLLMLQLIHTLEEIGIELTELETVLSGSSEDILFFSSEETVKCLMANITNSLQFLCESDVSVEKGRMIIQSVSTLFKLMSDSFLDISRRSSVSMFAPDSLDICLDIIGNSTNNDRDIKDDMLRGYGKMVSVLSEKILPVEMTVKYCQRLLELVLLHEKNDFSILVAVGTVKDITKIRHVYYHDFYNTFLLLERFVEKLNEPQYDYYSMGLTIWSNVFTTWDNIPRDQENNFWQILLFRFLPRWMLKLKEIDKGGNKMKNRIKAIMCNVINIVFRRENLVQLSQAQGIQWNELCGTIMDYFIYMMKNSSFPENWFSFNLEFSRIILNCIQTITELMFHFHMVDGGLWRKYFQLASIFTLQECLQLQLFKPYKRHKIMESYGDLRLKMINHMQEIRMALSRECLDESDNVFDALSITTESILPLTFIPVSTIRNKVLPLWCGYLGDCCTEENTNEVVVVVGKTMESFLQNYNVAEEYVNIMMAMTTRLKTLNHPESAVMDKITRLLEEHLTLQNVSESDGSRRKEILCLNRLMTFFVEEIPVKEFEWFYLYELVQVYEESNVLLEAALLLKKHALSIDWSTGDPLPKMISTIEPYLSLKEFLCWRVLDYFDKAKAWEYGFEIADALTYYYRTTYNYPKLSQILEMQSKFLKDICKIERAENSYFSVRFYGKQLPLYLSESSFIYRGAPYYELAAFQDQLKNDYPDFKILSVVQFNQKQQILEDEKIIVLAKVKPECSSVCCSISLPEYVRIFYESNCISRFYLDRPFHKEPRDPSNEVKTLHVERTVFHMRQPFPSGSIWCSPQSQETIILSPVQVAAESVDEKCRELQRVMLQHENNKQSDLRPFTMVLVGTLDAAVMGGIAMYLKAFYNTDFMLTSGVQQKYFEDLRNSFKNLLNVLQQALQVHGSRVTNEIKHLHERLLDCYATMKQNINQLDRMSSIPEFSISKQIDDIYGEIEEAYGSSQTPSRTTSIHEEEMLSLPSSSRKPSQAENPDHVLKLLAVPGLEKNQKEIYSPLYAPSPATNTTPRGSLDGPESSISSKSRSSFDSNCAMLPPSLMERSQSELTDIDRFSSMSMNLLLSERSSTLSDRLLNHYISPPSLPTSSSSSTTIDHHQQQQHHPRPNKLSLQFQFSSLDSDKKLDEEGELNDYGLAPPVPPKRTASMAMNLSSLNQNIPPPPLPHRKQLGQHPHSLNSMNSLDKWGLPTPPMRTPTPNYGASPYPFVSWSYEFDRDDERRPSVEHHMEHRGTVYCSVPNDDDNYPSESDLMNVDNEYDDVGGEGEREREEEDEVGKENENENQQAQQQMDEEEDDDEEEEEDEDEIIWCDRRNTVIDAPVELNRIDEAMSKTEDIFLTTTFPPTETSSMPFSSSAPNKEETNRGKLQKTTSIDIE